MKVCRECLQVNGHHPNCPENDDDDFIEEPDIFDSYREHREREDHDVC